MFIITQTNPVIFSHYFLESFFAGNLSGYQMVCSLAGVQMSTLPQEDVGCWKLAAQYIQKEFKEADEANLLDEEDMHVFGLRPMVDPLILVSCNSCKKPVKASQYATHAEICRSLSSLVGHTTENDVPVKKKPPRKERKKSQISIVTQVASVGTPGRYAVTKTTASNSHLDEQKATSLPIQPKGRDESQARSVKNVNGVTSLQTPGKFNDDHLQTKDDGTRILSVPAPLATKIYYSQRNQRLRSAISQMYYRSSSSQHDHGQSNMQFSESNTMPSTNGYAHHNQIDYQPEKLGKHLPTMVDTDPFPAKRSEANSNDSTRLLPVNFPDQFYVNTALGPQRSMGNLASDIIPASYLSDES